MTNKFLYIYWALLYAICAVLGFLNLPDWIGVVASLVFFLPPAVLLYRAAKNQDRKAIRLIRTVSIVWLAVAAVMIILNIASVSMSAQAGNILYYMLIVLTSPMVCGKYWLLSMFLWACLLITSMQQLKR